MKQDTRAQQMHAYRVHVRVCTVQQAAALRMATGWCGAVRCVDTASTDQRCRVLTGLQCLSGLSHSQAGEPVVT
jgi:hypothetical protein